MPEIARLLPDNTLTDRRAHAGPLPGLSTSKGMGAWKHVVDTPPSFNPAIETRAATGHTVDGDTVTITYSVTARPLADVKADRLAALAAYRYERETGGTTIGGVAVATDRQSQAMISGAYAAAQNDVIGSFDWKADSGWVTLDKPTMIAIGAAVAAHVQACFTNEREHAEAIAALNSASAVAAYDFTAGWP